MQIQVSGARGKDRDSGEDVEGERHKKTYLSCLLLFEFIGSRIFPLSRPCPVLLGAFVVYIQGKRTMRVPNKKRIQMSANSR